MTQGAAGGHDTAPLISISIVSHGDWLPLAALLESLAAHESIGVIQLVITDNLGRDLPDLAPGGWHSVVIERPARPRGFGANHNAAFSNASGEFFCVLNPDVYFTQGVLEKLVGHLQSGRGQVVAPVLVDSHGEIQDSFREMPTPWGVASRRLGLAPVRPAVVSEDLLYPDWIAGMFMLMRSSTYSRSGGFDPRYRLYFEDVDLCTRLRLAGFSILVDPSLRLLHDPRRRSRRPGRHFLWHLGSALRFFSSPGYRRIRGMQRNA